MDNFNYGWSRSKPLTGDEKAMQLSKDFVTYAVYHKQMFDRNGLVRFIEIARRWRVNLKQYLLNIHRKYERVYKHTNELKWKVKALQLLIFLDLGTYVSPTRNRDTTLEEYFQSLIQFYYGTPEL